LLNSASIGLSNREEEGGKRDCGRFLAHDATEGKSARDTLATFLSPVAWEETKEAAITPNTTGREREKARVGGGQPPCLVEKTLCPRDCCSGEKEHERPRRALAPRR